MKKFSYRLESLLKVKEHLEKERQKEHAAAMQKVQRQKDELARIDVHRAQTIDHQREVLVGKLTLAELLICSRYLVRLRKDGLAGAEVLRACEREAEKKREKLVEAAKQRKIYESHKERQRTKFNEAVKLAEAKENDEIAGNIYRQKKKK